MKSIHRSCAALACSALLGSACLVAAAPAAAGERILNLSDTLRLSARTEEQLEAAKEATLKYRDINVAIADGYVQGSPDVPGEGYHYLNPKYLDCKFDPRHPEILLYAFPPGKTQLQLVALEYAIPYACMPQNGPPPEGFAGSLDVWHSDEPVPFWTVNAWLYFRNPDGLFTLENPLIP
jgi:hypothetical protein